MAVRFCLGFWLMADLQDESTAQLMRFPRKLCRTGRKACARRADAWSPHTMIVLIQNTQNRETGIAMCAMPVCRRLSEMMSEQRDEEN